MRVWSGSILWLAPGPLLTSLQVRVRDPEGGDIGHCTGDTGLS